MTSHFVESHGLKAASLGRNFGKVDVVQPHGKPDPPRTRLDWSFVDFVQIGRSTGIFAKFGSAIELFPKPKNNHCNSNAGPRYSSKS
jgi:DNA mismatch repair protein MutH